MQKGIDYTGISITFFCHDGEGNYLFNKRSHNCRDEHGCWDSGGGALEFGGDVIETLKREIKEEYCTDVLDYEFLGFRDVHRVHEEVPTHWIALNFKVLVNRDQVRNGEPRKFDDLQWFSLDELPEPVHSQLPVALAEYKDRL